MREGVPFSLKSIEDIITAENDELDCLAYTYMYIYIYTMIYIIIYIYRNVDDDDNFCSKSGYWSRSSSTIAR